MNTVDEVRREALSLSIGERATIAHDLLVSLDAPSELILDSKYEAEIQRRVALICSGKASGEPAETVFAELEEKLGCQR
jgi:putative addiction module component (TIGR02574 family)